MISWTPFFYFIGLGFALFCREVLSLERRKRNSFLVLAERLDISRQIISAWENGKKEIPESRNEQMSYIVRGTEVFAKVADAMDGCY